MNSEPQERIFEAALALPLEQRAACLDQLSAGDAKLRERVEALLRAHDKAGAFMAEPAGPANSQSAHVAISLTEKPGDKIGHYKLLQQIGEGGCGVVYMAEQEEPIRRRVALKVIKLGMDTKAVIARFEAERQALALMDHPNIAKVLDAGATETGRPYFVMELVRGTKITAYCDQNNLPTEDRLNLFIQVCHAIQHAHQKGIIHRDIKPSNILVTVNDGVPVPKVIDFGIAKATGGQMLTDKTLFTAFEQFIGTPAYMSPEQAQMTSLDIDTRADVYALGVLLYELLVGRTPFETKTLLAGGLDEMRRMIREQDPPRPSTRLRTLTDAEQTTVATCHRTEVPRLVHQIRGDLDWIVMKCLEKDRKRRYETVNALALDVESRLVDRPVAAAPPSWHYRLTKFVRRNRVATAFALMLLTATTLSTWLAVRANQARTLAQRREAEAREHLWASYLATARASRQSGQPGRRFAALDAAAKAAAIRPTVELRSEAASALALVDVRPIQELAGPPNRAMRATALDPTCSFYACADEYGSLSVRRLSDSREVLSLGAQGEPVYFTPRFSPNGRWLAAQIGRLSRAGRDVQVWDLHTGRPLLVTPLKVDGDSMDFHPQLPLVGAVDQVGDAHVCDVESGRNWSWASGARTPNAVRFRPHANQLVIWSPDHGIRFHEVESGRVVATMPQTNRVGLVWSADGKWLVGHSEDGQVLMWDFSRGGVLDSAFEAHHSFISRASLDPQAEILLTQSWDSTLALWSLASRSLLLRWASGEGQPCICLDGRRLGPSFTGRIAQLLEIERAPECRILRATAGPSDCNGTFSPDGGWVVVPGAGRIECWEVGGCKRAWVEPVDGPRFIAFHPDGSRLAVSGHAGLSEWPWDLGTGNGPPRLGAAHQLATRLGSRIEFSRDGSVLVSSQANGLLVLPSRGSDPAMLPMPMCNFASVSPDGKWAAASPWAGPMSDVRVWELPDGQEAFRLDKTLAAVQFTRDGRWLVLLTDELIECRSVGNWQPVSQLPLERGQRQMALSNNGRWCAVQQGLQHILLCELPTFLPILTLDTGPEAPVCFSPDNTLLLTRRGSGQFSLWDLGLMRRELTAMGLGW
jgi:serine/threonine protein kinase/WD40 repeat protein